MRKKVLSIVLAVCMLASLLAVPVSAIVFEPTPTVQLQAVSFTENGMYPTEGAAITEIEAGKTFAIKISVTNQSTSALNLSGFRLEYTYDVNTFEPYTYTYLNIDEDEVSTGPDCLQDPNLGGLSNWSMENNIGNGTAIFVGTSSTPKKVKAGRTQTIAYLLLKVKAEVENGAYSFGFNGENYINHLVTGAVKDEAIENVSFTNKLSLNVTGGTSPKIAKTTVSPATAEYASNAELTLGAATISGKDAAGLVTFKVEDENKNDVTKKFTLSGNKLTVKSTEPVADVGTYYVIATPQGDACELADVVTNASFTITQKPITNPTVTITGFGKGLPVTGATATADNMTVACGWYTGEENPGENNVATGKFAANSPYTLTLILTPNKNYKLADDMTVTVKGLGDDQVIEHASNPLIVRARTTAKDATSFKGSLGIGSSKTPCYGDTLSQIELNTAGAQAVAYVDGVETVIPGTFTWKDPTEKVGDAGGYRSHTVVFTPSGEYADLYEGFDKNISFYVQKKVLNISDLTWTWSNDTLTYTGESQSITLNNPSDLDGLVDVTYDTTEGRTNTATNVGIYTAAAVLTLRDAENYIFSGANSEDGSSHTIEKAWKISKADLTAADKTVEVRYGTDSKDLTLADLGLSALANEPGVDILFDVTGGGDVINNALLVRDGEDKITGITLALKETDANSVNKTGSVKLKIKSDNYADKELTVTVKIVNKDTQSLTVTGPASFPYGTTAETIKNALTVTGLPTGYDASKVTYTFSNSNISTAAPAEGYKVTVGYEDDNFLYSGEYTFEITARSIADADVTFKALTYNGSEQTTEITVKIGEKTLTMGTDYTVTGDLKGTNAGEYTVTVNGTGNYTGELTAKFTIAKATPTAAAFTFTAPANLTYDGNPKTADVTANNTEIGAVTVSYAPADPTNAGTYTVKISTAETTNYKAATNLTDAAWTFTIAPATILDTMVGSIGDLTYTGEALTPALSVASLTAGTDYEVTYANNTNAGTATATVTGKGNYEGTIVRNFTIKPASMNFVKEVYVSRHTNVRTEQTITLQSITGVKGETLTPSVTLEAPSSADDIFTVHPAYNAETGNVTFTLNGTAGSATYKVKLASPNSNYAPGEYNLVFTASHRTAIAITFEDGSATYTSSPIRYENASAGESGTWTYTYVPVEGSGASLDAVTSLPLTVGTYKVTAHFENADHIGDKTVTFVINKATPATPPEIKVDGGDKKLSDLEAGMRAAMGGIGGTFEWYDSNGNRLESTTKIEANTEYRWKFIPADPDNYNSIEGKTTPYVRDDLSWLPGVLGGGSSFSFHDVTRFDYYYDSVKWAADNGIASGTSRFAFSPDAVCTRAQTVTFLWRAAGSPLPRYRVSPFTDVHSYDYYYEAVLWAVEQGITTGLTATTFGPDETVTRGQVATFLYRAASAAKPNTFNPFTDVKPTAYNYGAILWAYDNRITTGTSTTTFSPDAFCTRAQIVTFLYRYYQGR